MKNIKKIIASALLISLIGTSASVLANEGEKLLISTNKSEKEVVMKEKEDKVYVEGSLKFIGTVVEITEEDDCTLVLIENEEGEKITGVITEETAFNKNIEIEKDMQVELLHSHAMTRSAIPQSVVYGVNFLYVNEIDNEAEVMDISRVTGVVLDVMEDGDNKSILIDGKYGEHIFHIGEDTRINVEEIEMGDTVNVYYSGIATMSLPPQSPAIAINVYNKDKINDYKIHIEDTENQYGYVIKNLGDSILIKTLDGEFEKYELKSTTPMNTTSIEKYDFVQILTNDDELVGVNLLERKVKEEKVDKDKVVEEKKEEIKNN